MQSQDNWKAPAMDADGKIIPPTEDAQQMPLNMLGSADGLAGDAFGTPSAEAGRKMPGMVLVLGVILLVGGGALWAMRMTGSSTGAPDKEAQAAESKIDETLKKLAASGEQGANLSRKSLEAFFEDADKVVALFNNDPVKNQVALEDLAKNPFELEAESASNAEEVPTVTGDYQREETLRKLKDELGDLKLQSVVSGSKSLAIISGEVVRVGETIGSFTVESIAAEGVKLTAEGESFQIKLPAPGAKAPTAGVKGK